MLAHGKVKFLPEDFSGKTACKYNSILVVSGILGGNDTQMISILKYVIFCDYYICPYYGSYSNFFYRAGTWCCTAPRRFICWQLESILLLEIKLHIKILIEWNCGITWCHPKDSLAQAKSEISNINPGDCWRNFGDKLFQEEMHYRYNFEPILLHHYFE